MTDAKLRELERRWRATGSTTARDAYLRAMRRLSPEQVYLVYRTHYEDPSCKRIVKLKGASVLEWFQRGWEAAAKWKLPADAEEWTVQDFAHEWVAKQTKGSIYGLASIFGAARHHRLPPPKTWDELRSVLHEHLYVEGGPPTVSDPIVVVLTDDDEVDLAYYLFTQSAVDLAPERLSYLLHRNWRLPTAAAKSGSFTPRIDLPEVEPGGSGPGATYLVDMTIRDGMNLQDLEHDQAVRVLPGVRVPDLPDYLRTAEVDEEWPIVFLGLRMALGPREKTLTKAVKRCVEHNTDWLAHAAEGTTTYAEAREALAAAWATPESRSEPDPENVKASKRACSKHLLCVSRWDRWKFDRWIVFDDLWATANPDLAQSLLWYGAHEDPFR